jgi:hypothetical protein
MHILRGNERIGLGSQPCELTCGGRILWLENTVFIIETANGTKPMKTNRAFLAGAIASAVIVLGANAQTPYTIAQMEALSTGTLAGLGVPTSTPVVTAILSTPGTLDGYTYSSYSFLVNDGTGSADIFGSLAGLGYTPTVGDSINVSGTYSPYHQIPELGTVTAASLNTSGNSVPGPATTTIPTAIASGTGPMPLSLAGYLLTIDNVSLYTDSGATIPVSGNFATHANTTLYMKDGGGNIMELYVWASSYSTDGAMGGTAIPTGTVDVTGFLTQNGAFGPEMTPMSITQVPEPSTLVLAGLGLAGLLVSRRRNS